MHCLLNLKKGFKKTKVLWLFGEEKARINQAHDSDINLLMLMAVFAIFLRQR